jgi:hypothetical protein
LFGNFAELQAVAGQVFKIAPGKLKEWTLKNETSLAKYNTFFTPIALP